MSQEKETIIIIHEEIICLSGDIPTENLTPVLRRGVGMLERLMEREKRNKENNIEEPHHNIIRND